MGYKIHQVVLDEDLGSNNKVDLQEQKTSCHVLLVFVVDCSLPVTALVQGIVTPSFSGFSHALSVINDARYM